MKIERIAKDDRRPTAGHRPVNVLEHEEINDRCNRHGNADQSDQQFAHHEPPVVRFLAV